ncbi:MAG: c-type cytochrome [Anaerolineales bacterium]|nr:c-type cytochrome [Anaerolineales bacterium]
MKLRYPIILAIVVTLLTACNFTLAADVTPPPGYVAPTPAPTLGPLYPASAPDLESGAAIYVEKCAPCHGHTGLGDGPDGKQLPVTVAAFALPETARKASPAAWYTMVTQGNLDRFMPPFLSLSDQQRWDVVSYALTLHTTDQQVETGKSLFEENCADCAKAFSNQEMMSALTEDQIVKMIKEGAGDVPAFGSSFSDEEAYAVAAYIRTLTFALPPAPVVAAATETPVAAATDSGTPSAEATPLDGTAQAQVTPEATVEPVAVTGGSISGLVNNLTGKDLLSDQAITLRVFEHGNADPAAGPQEILALEGTVNEDGTYSFDGVEILENQIFLAELEVEGLSYQSEFAVAPAGATELTLTDIVIYSTTDDFSSLRIDETQIFFDFATEGVVQIFSVYNITNASDKTIVISMGTEQKVPFIAFPEGSEGLGYEAGQDSAAFVPTADGFAMPPSNTPYSLIAFASVPKAKEISISQPALLPIGEVALFLPEGVEAEGDTLTDEGIQNLQGTNFHVYSASAISEGKNLDLVLTGEPKDSTAVAPDVTQNKNLLIGIGALGLVLILAGVWMYMRDSKKEEEIEEEEDEFDDSESIMDAIIAIDELHRAGKLSDQAYKERREELKNALKRKS